MAFHAMTLSNRASVDREVEHEPRTRASSRRDGPRLFLRREQEDRDTKDSGRQDRQEDESFVGDHLHKPSISQSRVNLTEAYKAFWALERFNRRATSSGEPPLDVGTWLRVLPVFKRQ